MPDSSTHDAHDPDLQHAKLYQVRQIERRIDAVESTAKEHSQFASDLADLITEARIELAKVSTKIQVWGVIVTVGAPLLATFGAWLVIRNTTPGSPIIAPKAAAQCVDLPDIPITARAVARSMP